MATDNKSSLGVIFDENDLLQINAMMQNYVVRIQGKLLEKKLLRENQEG